MPFSEFNFYRTRNQLDFFHGVKGVSTVRLFLTKLSVFFSLFCVSALPRASSLDGCINSPENPTFILGMIGLSGAVAPWICSQLNKQRKRRQNQKK